MPENHVHSSVLKRWLSFAPPPPELPDGKQWHVFLSYRSLNRGWVLQLYDALREAGYEVFLDQFVLVPGDSLVRSLEQGLDGSAAGIIVWSEAYDGSEWCHTEYDAMNQMVRESGSSFRFVIAKIDGKIPRLGRNSIWVDFEGQPDGPSGEGILALMCGLAGVPKSDEAVRFATELDASRKRELAAIHALRESGDAAGLVRASESDAAVWHASPLLLCACAEALIALERNDDAVSILKRASTRFHRSTRVPQLLGLAAARMGDWRTAQNQLGTLYQQSHRDPETLGILARTWMDRYKATDKRTYLRKSRDLYAEAFALVPDDYYTGINAAAKSVLLGELDEAAEYAAKVEEVVGKDKVPGDYWKTATVAEVQLIQKNFAGAARLYEEAVLMEPESTGSHRSTLGQARLLMDKLGATADQRTSIEAAFE